MFIYFIIINSSNSSSNMLFLLSKWIIWIREYSEQNPESIFKCPEVYTHQTDLAIPKKREADIDIKAD